MVDDFKGKFIVVSNRLPLEIEFQDETESEDAVNDISDTDNVTIKPGSGGLITALTPLLKKYKGLWIGWDGDFSGRISASILDNEGRNLGYDLKTVSLTHQEVRDYYDRFCNETLWPLFHDYLGRTKFHRSTWRVYQHVNQKFAQIVSQYIEPNDFIWIQDYHLIMAGKYLKESGCAEKLTFFLHIPFPPWDLFMRLPWRKELIESLLYYDCIGFQTRRDHRNFIQCVRRLIPQIKVSYVKKHSVIKYAGKHTLVGAFPISIDFKEFEDIAKSKAVQDEAWYIHENLPEKKIILGIDRLDYTKGILGRLRSFEILLEKYPDVHEKITLVQVIVPSRINVAEYKKMRQNIEETVGRINGRFTVKGWVPVHYIYRRLSRIELAAYYRTCEIALITPLKDGMNLVAKEYCASCISGNGVLILSEFAGAASELKRDAILVNPYHVELVAEELYKALQMQPAEIKGKMRRLRNIVRRNNIFVWLDNFLKTAYLELPNDQGTFHP